MPISIDEYFDEIKEEEQRAQRYEQYQASLEKRAEKTVSTVEETSKNSAAKDTFTKSEANSDNPSGIYRITKDKDGAKRIEFNASQSGDGARHEIQQLKQEKTRIEMQLRLPGNINKKEKLEEKLRQIKAKLSRKEKEL